MKKLILILIVGSLCADTIEYKSNLFITTKKGNVEYLGVNNKVIYFKNEDGSIESLKCRLIKNIVDINNNSIDIDCSINTYTGVISPSSKPSYGGGMLVAIGGAYLYSTTTDGSYSDHIIEHHQMDIRIQISSLLIIIGGILIAFGI